MKQEHSQDYFDQIRREVLSVVERERSNRRRGWGDAVVADLRRLDQQVLLFVLAEMLSNQDEDFRCDIAEVMMLVNPEMSMPILLSLLDDPSSVLRWHICGLLHDFGDSRAIKPLIKVALEDNDPQVRSQACYALGQIGDAEALRALRQIQLHDHAEDMQGFKVSDVATLAIERLLERHIDQSDSAV